MTSTNAPSLLERISRGATVLTSRLTTPLLPDDYLALVNPLWAGTGAAGVGAAGTGAAGAAGELCGRITAVRRETAESASLLIKPGRGWAGHHAGQWVRVGVDIDGVRHYRTFSLSDAPGRPDGRLRITVKVNPEGVVSRHLVHGGLQGSIVQLSQAAGDFVLPDLQGEKLLFITAGSGVTPVVAMLRDVARPGRAMPDIVVLHSAPTPNEVILGGELRLLALRHPSIRLYERYTRSQGRLDLATDLEVLCPDWADRLTWVCGPAGLLDAATEHWAPIPDRLRQERFRPMPLAAESGEGGKVCFSRSGVVAEADGATPLLVVGEEAGALMPSGCRMGICFTCVGRLGSGRVRDLRTGTVHGEEGDLVQTCVSAAAGPVSLDL